CTYASATATIDNIVCTHILYHLPTSPKLPTPTLFPYTTLFRSQKPQNTQRNKALRILRVLRSTVVSLSTSRIYRKTIRRSTRCRSEEHTSELQSRENFVCRLLLEKKNVSLPFVVLI